jgi:putative addiction module component (TIGR02574 family)
MNTTSIRQRLHSYLETANDKKIKAIYTMVEDEIEKTGVEYTDELKEELDRRYAAYENGAEKPISSSESKKRIEKLLQAARKK